MWTIHCIVVVSYLIRRVLPPAFEFQANIRVPGERFHVSVSTANLVIYKLPFVAVNVKSDNRGTRKWRKMDIFGGGWSVQERRVSENGCAEDWARLWALVEGERERGREGERERERERETMDILLWFSARVLPLGKAWQTVACWQRL